MDLRRKDRFVVQVLLLERGERGTELLRRDHQQVVSLSLLLEVARGRGLTLEKGRYILRLALSSSLALTVDQLQTQLHYSAV